MVRPSHWPRIGGLGGRLAGGRATILRSAWKDDVPADFNISVDSWSRRKAVYHDIGRAMRALLVTQCGLCVADSSRLTPHGFRHLLVTAGVQLAGAFRQMRPGNSGAPEPKFRDA